MNMKKTKQGDVQNLYYTPPTKEIFEEVKTKSIELWNQYDDQFGYVTEKVDRIKDIGNVGDNLMFMVAMFDVMNMYKLSALLSKEAKKAIRERMVAGGSTDLAIIFN